MRELVLWISRHKSVQAEVRGQGPEHAGSFEDYKEGLHGWSRVSEREKSWKGTEVREQARARSSKITVRKVR